jgi:ankyrin repeat protein
MTSLLDHGDHIGNVRQYSDGVPSLMTAVDPGSSPLWPDLKNKIPQEPSVLPSPPMSLLKMDTTEAKGSLNDRRSSLLHLAIASGSAETLRFLLQNMEIFTSKRDAAGFTPLERAVVSGRTDMVAILLDHGVDLASDDEDSGPAIGNG